MTNSTDNKFPFPSQLNLRLLVEYWERNIKEGNLPGFSQDLIKAINEAPELREPINDLAILDKHRVLINFLLTAVIPPANQDTDISAAIFPFEFKSFFLF